MRKLFIRKR